MATASATFRNVTEKPKHMGSHANISADRFPRQGTYLGKTVNVCFHYDTSAEMRGKIIRDDSEEPGELIIQLENGWVVRSVECMYSFPVEQA